ncbi:helix-turn-helix domain-containing protein [Lampropedia puyangensis]|uniref:Helix-turn-helix domain-containing protein n=1 Tax=Lampropedia puyangensis TaxID=1330072 RepID=A0A4S8EYB3_9BURK|nr:helix-turn-helix domain-containing protein [Lampropedia puyangensis]THT99917.1 helix-turn-helix domain-containing protein [Lampropedia puyangensis]
MNARKINLEEMAQAVFAKVEPPSMQSPLSAALENTTSPNSTSASNKPFETDPAQAQAKTRQARKALGMPQATFASLIHTSAAELNDWEQGRKTPPGAAVRLFELLIKNPDLSKLWD